MKRLADVSIAAVLVVLLAPVLLLIAVAVVLDDPGPVLFLGSRVGMGGREFRIWKFRTMRTSWRTRPAAPQSEITRHQDPRVTRLGRVLRRTKLDELPQLFNVLAGQMSLVGPRPEAPYFVAFYTSEQRQVLRVRPGITGLSQVYFRHEEELLTGPDPERDYRTVVMPAKLAIDLYYIRRASLRLDLRIVALTILALVRRTALPPWRFDNEGDDGQDGAGERIAAPTRTTPAR